MVDVSLAEGRLSFQFIDVDFAEKYDEWSHYRNCFNSACVSSKAVDFIVSKNKEIWFIEVKDYRRHRRVKSIDMADEVALKVRDTMSGIVSTKFVGTDQSEVKISKAVLAGKKLHVALHLEQPSNPSRLFPISVNSANIKLKMKQIMKFADFHPIVINRVSFPGFLGTVTSI